MRHLLLSLVYLVNVKQYEIIMPPPFKEVGVHVYCFDHVGLSVRRHICPINN